MSSCNVFTLLFSVIKQIIIVMSDHCSICSQLDSECNKYAGKQWYLVQVMLH